MHRAWLILNKSSRSVGSDWEAMLGKAIADRGAELAGTTDFPDDALPTPAELDAADVDVAVVAAGDGTINALAAALDEWSGALLVLPGGTMNLLAKKLHGDNGPEAILAAVADPPATTQLPTADADGARAIVGAIAGPGATWVHTREAVRHGAWGRLSRAVRLAYVRTLSSSVRVLAGGRRSHGYRAIFVHPDGEALSIVKVSASGWADGVRLGFSYLTGSWENARGIDMARAAEITLAEDGGVHLLLDGEPLRLSSPTTLRLGSTKLRFVTTL